MKMVRVTWRDAASVDAWQSLKEAKKQKPCKCVSVGHLVKASAKKVVVANTLGGGDVCATMVIPRAWVLKIEELQVKE